MAEVGIHKHCVAEDHRVVDRSVGVEGNKRIQGPVREVRGELLDPWTRFGMESTDEDSGAHLREVLHPVRRWLLAHEPRLHLRWLAEGLEP